MHEKDGKQADEDKGHFYCRMDFELAKLIFGYILQGCQPQGAALQQEGSVGEDLLQNRIT
jgi:hypothetical protein